MKKDKGEKEIHIKVNTEFSKSDTEKDEEEDVRQDVQQKNEDQNVEVDVEVKDTESPTQEAEEIEEEKAEKNSVSADVIEKSIEEKEIDYKDQLLRLQAEFINYRKRIMKEFEQIRTIAKIEFIKSLLPIMDNFESAIEHSKELDKDTDNIISGFYLIYEQLKNILTKEGIEILNPMGEYFDPNYHEAIAMVDDGEFEGGQIVIVNQKGYKYKDILLRPAKVIVAKNTPSE